ncbi:MAG TPA: hypothetical protein DCS66_12920, partial [Flavobacteriaceae bacterium]|nr:hypothetical protein [Flavobacteriaceae bacterium]
PEAEKALEILNNKFSDFGFEFDISEKNFNAEIAITAPNGESLIISPIADNDQEIQNFIKENSGEHITKDEIAINEQLLKDYNEGKIDLTAAQLSKIVKITPEAEEYVMGFMPKFEDIKEGINPKTKQSYLYEEYFKAINKAYVGDPRTQEIGENTEKEILDSEEWINKQKELQNLHINLGVDKEQYDLLSKEAKELKIQIEDPKFIENINKEWQKRVDWMQGQCQKWGIYCDEKWYKSNPEFSNHPLIREFNNKVDQINGIIDNKTSDEDLQVMVEAYQDAITKEYNEEFQKR